MNDAMVLAIDAASRRLAYEWDKEAVRRAFEDGWPRHFRNALKLLGAVIGGSAIELLMLYDVAGMSKEEMTSAIWKAAHRYYEESIKGKAVSE